MTARIAACASLALIGVATAALARPNITPAPLHSQREDLVRARFGHLRRACAAVEQVHDLLARLAATQRLAQALAETDTALAQAKNAAARTSLQATRDQQATQLAAEREAASAAVKALTGAPATGTAATDSAAVLAAVYHSAKADFDAVSTSCAAKGAACVGELVDVCGPGARSDQALSSLIMSDIPELAAAALPSGGAGWEAAVVSGLAGFVADRAQQEVVAWLLSLFESELCAVADGGSKWFPSLCAWTANAGDEARLVASTQLAAALRADLEALPVHVVVAAAGKNADALAFAKVVEAAWAVFVAVRRGDRPLEVIAGLGNAELVKAACPDGGGVGKGIACDLRCAAALVGALKDVDLPRDKLRDLLADPGRLHDEIVLIVSDTRLRAAMHTIQSDTPVDMPPLLSLLWRTPDGDIDTIRKTLACDATPPSPACAGLEGVERLFRDAVRVADTVENARTGPAAERALDVLHQTNVVLLDALALTRGMPTRVAALEPEAVDALSSLLRGRYVDGVRDAVALLGDVAAAAGGDKPSLPEALRRYLPLVGSLAEAKTASEVHDVLESAAEPIGGWRHKRHPASDAFTLSVAAQIGVLGGREFVWGTAAGDANPDKLGDAWAAGLMAQLGVDFTFHCPRQSSWTWGFYGTVLDLGQLVWARIDHVAEVAPATGKKLGLDRASDVGFLDVLSPGLYFRVGVSDSPFVLGFGASIAPRLRNYTYQLSGTGASSEPVSDLFTMVRVGVFLGVDETLLFLKR